MIRLDRVGKTFRGGDGAAVEALRDVSLEVAAGEFVALAFARGEVGHRELQHRGGRFDAGGEQGDGDDQDGGGHGSFLPVRSVAGVR